MAVAGLRLAECVGQMAQAVLALADPVAPICTDKPREPDSEWRRVGQAERRVAPCGTTFAHR